MQIKRNQLILGTVQFRLRMKECCKVFLPATVTKWNRLFKVKNHSKLACSRRKVSVIEVNEPAEVVFYSLSRKMRATIFMKIFRIIPPEATNTVDIDFHRSFNLICLIIEWHRRTISCLDVSLNTKIFLIQI